jgi:hypothetical protein
MAGKTLKYENWVPFSWYGIGLDIPAEWNPGKIAGDHKSGNVRLDDPTTVRLEVEWKEARGDDRVAIIVDRYVEGLAKGAQKEKSSLNVKRQTDCTWLDLPNMTTPEYFTWDTEYSVHTIAVYSPVSDRLIFVRIMLHPHEDPGSTLMRILNSLTDTSPDEAQTWSLYDLICTSPPGYVLETYELKSGHIRLRFDLGRNSVQVDRLSLAEMLLKNRTLSDWYKEFFRKELRHSNIETSEAKTFEHMGIEVTGKPKSRWRGLLAPLPFWNVRPRLNMEGRVWPCMESNKIYCVQIHWKNEKEAPDLPTCCEGVRCHAPTTKG